MCFACGQTEFTTEPPFPPLHLWGYYSQLWGDAVTAAPAGRDLYSVTHPHGCQVVWLMKPANRP